MKIRGCAAVAACAFMLAACAGPQSMFDTHGASAIQLKQLIIWIIAVCSFVWALVMVVLIGALTRTRRDGASAEPVRERRLTASVAASVVATVLIISGLTVASFYTTRALRQDDPSDVTIRVRGQQWWWEVRYLDSDPARGFITANEIHVPVGRSVRLQLESTDVIHSFWVPSIAGKLDMIPGRKNDLTIRAENPGVYRGQCAEFCGLQHSHMALLVIAHEEADFERWRDEQRRDAQAPPSPDADAGRTVFLSKPCAACHTIRGTDAAGSTGPDLTHVGSRRTIAAGLLENTRGAMAAWIADPQTAKPGNNMPMVPLTADELQNISAYMASLR